jgi:hypothetical protein
MNHEEEDKNVHNILVGGREWADHVKFLGLARNIIPNKLTDCREQSPCSKSTSLSATQQFNQNFMKSEGSLPYSQESSTSP